MLDHVALGGPLDGEYWKLVTTAFVHLDHFGYAFIALTAVGVLAPFGTS